MGHGVDYFDEMDMEALGGVILTVTNQQALRSRDFTASLLISLS
jgi:hypothetical protein